MAKEKLRFEAEARYKFRLTLTEEILGSSPSDPEVAAQYTAGNSGNIDKTAEEVAAIEKAVEVIKENGTEIDEEDPISKGITVFPRDEDGNPFLWDYQIKGFFKNAAKLCYQKGGDYKLTAYKGKIDNGLHIFPRKIPVHIPEGKEMGICQRPLMAETMKGPRTAIAVSETIPEGTWFDIEVECDTKDMDKYVECWLDVGSRIGLGQWRNSGKGRFEWEPIEED